MHVVDIPTCAPRDLHRRTARVLTFDQFGGYLTPGAPVLLRFDGREELRPGHVLTVDHFHDTIVVESDFQALFARHAGRRHAPPANRA